LRRQALYNGTETINAVDGISLTVEAGQFAALYGPSGSGKTTLLMMAAGLSRPDAGSISLAGREISSLSPSESARFRREEVGIVFQSFHLMPGASALDNAILKLGSLGLTPGQARDRARPWLERLGLAKRMAHTPSEMSMGERQRVVIARALTTKPRLLLADEPTGHLDSKRGREVLQILAEVGSEENIPILLVTHDPNARAFVSDVYTLRDGALTVGLAAELGPTPSNRGGSAPSVNMDADRRRPGPIGQGAG
jgi:putative ABC transport system ATP-binding protein